MISFIGKDVREFSHVKDDQTRTVVIIPGGKYAERCSLLEESQLENV